MLFAIENDYKYFTCNVTLCGWVDTAGLSVILQKQTNKQTKNQKKKTQIKIGFLSGKSINGDLG